MGWVFVAPMSQTGRQTESEGWKLELGQIWLEMWESNESKYFEIHCDFYPLLHFDVQKHREKERHVKIWAWLQTIFNQPPPIGLLLLQACDLPPPSLAPLNSHQLVLANFKQRSLKNKLLQFTKLCVANVISQNTSAAWKILQCLLNSKSESESNAKPGGKRGQKVARHWAPPSPLLQMQKLMLPSDYVLYSLIFHLDYKEI